MTKIKIAPKRSTAADKALAGHIERLYENPGSRMLAIVELVHIDRTMPTEDSGLEPSVTVRLNHVEPSDEDTEKSLEAALQALYALRTATGTLTEDSDVELGERTLENLGNSYAQLHAAKISVAATEAWRTLDSALKGRRPTEADLIHAVQEAAGVLRRALLILDGDDDKLDF